MPMEKIAVLMSGGVDSSVAAGLLKEQGHDVVGLTYNIGRSPSTHDSPLTTHGAKRCCGTDDMTDAATVAFQIGIPHYVVNLAAVFNREIVGNFVDGYMRGETPLPCAHCNTRVKWGEVALRARELGAGRVATGHYARVEWNEHRRRFVLKKARDLSKDQSYFLFGLSQEQLAQAVFPLGELTKQNVRARAESMSLVVSEKKDSQELCFVPSGHYSDFVRGQGSAPSTAVNGAPGTAGLPGAGARGQMGLTGDRRPTTGDEFGDIVDTGGTVLGTHNGYYKFTVGQRRGLGVEGGPFYVKAIEPASRRVIVGRAEDILTDRLLARDPNLIGYESWEAVGRVRARIRYRHEGEWASVSWDGRTLSVDFEQPVRAIAPGQAVVFYNDDEVVGGAWITGQS